ncbi:response regulator [uncultured Fluviicola sp.]|uniref:response regulator n=1 Tax=uncultured Fluviicola sp. TaxID=463303 RepID=UPI0025E59564|nr:response regulator [uncultured Fluviicola sp.]
MSFWKDLFKAKEQEKTGLVFIVEDNKPYAETLKVFLGAEVPAIEEMKLFPVGETCLLELKKNPDIIIIDYFLDSKYYDAETGLEIIKQIRTEKPEVNIIVLSSQEDIDVVLEMVKKYNCSYVKKDAEAFEKVGEIVAEIYK